MEKMIHQSEHEKMLEFANQFKFAELLIFIETLEQKYHIEYIISKNLLDVSVEDKKQDIIQEILEILSWKLKCSYELAQFEKTYAYAEILYQEAHKHNYPHLYIRIAAQVAQRL